VVVAAWLRERGWDRARAPVGAETGQDVKDLPGWSVEIKARADFNPMAWLKQAKKNAKPGQKICAVFRCNGQGETAGDYLVLCRLEDHELASGPDGELALLRKLVHEHAMKDQPGCPLAVSAAARHADDFPEDNGGTSGEQVVSAEGMNRLSALEEVYRRMYSVPGSGLKVYEGRVDGFQSWRDATPEEAEYYRQRMSVWDGYEEHHQHH